MEPLQLIFLCCQTPPAFASSYPISLTLHKPSLSCCYPKQTWQALGMHLEAAQLAWAHAWNESEQGKHGAGDAAVAAALWKPARGSGKRCSQASAHLEQLSRLSKATQRMQCKLIEQLRHTGDAVHCVEIITIFLCAEKLLKLCIVAAIINWSPLSACIPPYTEAWGILSLTAELRHSIVHSMLTPLKLGCALGE